MQHFMIVLILYINLLNLDKRISIFEEYGAFKIGLLDRNLALTSVASPNYEHVFVDVTQLKINGFIFLRLYVCTLKGSGYT